MKVNHLEENQNVIICHNDEEFRDWLRKLSALDHNNETNESKLSN